MRDIALIVDDIKKQLDNSEVESFPLHTTGMLESSQMFNQKKFIST